MLLAYCDAQTMQTKFARFRQKSSGYYKLDQVAYAEFLIGGGPENLRLMKTRIKKSLLSNLVRFLAKKRSSPTVSVLKLFAQVTKGGPCHNFAYFSMLII